MGALIVFAIGKALAATAHECVTLLVARVVTALGACAYMAAASA